MAMDPNAILAVTQPKLTIRKIALPDNQALYNTENNENRLDGFDVKHTTGFSAPHIEIDNYIISPNRLLSLSINQNGFLPELTVSFLDLNGAFSGMYFPRTNPILKLYIKSIGPSLKPVRSDYIITNIVSSGSSTLYDSNGQIESIYTATAKLYIPGIYGNTIQSIPKKRSWEALKQIADSLKLGFATNETSTDDEMTWINPNDTVENFIKDICKRAYKNEKSFFGCFIDTNYILNFVNYEKALSKETKLIEIPGDSLLAQNSAHKSAESLTTEDMAEPDQTSIEAILSSSIRRAKTGLNIVHYSMYSSHGEILSNQAFRKTAVWHDRNYYLDNKGPIKHFIEPLSEKTISGTLTVYQKPKLENFETETTVRWLGIDYNNGHRNYKFSKLINGHNLDELSKNYLVVKIPGISQAIYRGGKIGVEIARRPGSNVDNMIPDHQFGEDLNGLLGAAEVVDAYLSGPYVVKDINYMYDATPEHSELRYSTEFTLVRREWVELLESNKLLSEKKS